MSFILRALRQRRPKADFWAVPIAALPAVFLIVKTLGVRGTDGHFHPGLGDIGIVLAATGAILAAAYKYIAALKFDNSLNDGAQKHVIDMLLAQGVTPDDEPGSEWKLFRKGLWAKVFRLFGIQ